MAYIQRADERTIKLKWVPRGYCLESKKDAANWCTEGGSDSCS